MPISKNVHPPALTFHVTPARSDKRGIIPIASTTSPNPRRTNIPRCKTTHSGRVIPVTSENKSGNARPHGSTVPHNKSVVPK